jgi:hypothetical protein
MSNEWRNTSIKIVLVLFVICIMLFAFSFVNPTSFTGKSLAEAYDLPIGQSMFENDSILDDGQMIEVPFLSNPSFIVHQIVTLDLGGILMTLTTGAVPFDFSTVSSEGIDSYGNVIGFEGPGYLTLDGEKLKVKAPENYVWGYSAPYKVLTKTEDGVDVVVNGTVVQSVPADEIKNLNFSNDFYNVTTIINWYNYDSKIGSNFTLEKGIVGFSDGRDNISYEDIERIFGKNVSDYVDAYPSGTPIVLYMGDISEEDGEVFYTSLGSYPEYGNDVREFNARQFVDAWNNTIIPPNSSGNGRDYISFGSASDPEAPGGSAAHGVCPPARALRAAVLAEGFSLPVGMSGDENAVLFGYNPASDIKVTNNHDYPVKIIMWTEGSGTGMVIYAKIIRLKPATNMTSTSK